MSLLVAIATYNEVENLPSLVAAVRRAVPQADILVVDDNSPDGTGRWCDEEAARSENFRVLHRAGKMGLGSASWLAMREAIDQGYDLLATLDADWSHPPEAIPALVAAASKYDVVIGSRYCPGGKIDGWPISRRLVSRVMNLATRVMLRLPVLDASTACRVYRVEALARLNFAELTEQGYAYLEEILWRLARAGATFGEAPITFVDRRAGASKVNFNEALGKLRVLARLGGERLRRGAAQGATVT